MAWHGYVLVEADPAFAAQLTAARRTLLVDEARRLLKIARRRYGGDTTGIVEGDWPPYLLQARWRLDHRAVLLEGYFERISKADLAAEVAGALNVSPATVNAALDVTAFAPGESWEDSRDAALLYLAQHDDEWNTGRA